MAAIATLDTVQSGLKEVNMLYKNNIFFFKKKKKGSSMLLTQSPDLLPYQQDNPIGQGVHILLYSHCVITIRSLAYKNLPGLNYMWLWGICSV